MPQEKKKLSEIEIHIGGVSLTQKALFARHLAVMLNSGLPIVEALDIARDSATGRLKKIIARVSKSVESGSPLSKALSPYPKLFSGLFISAVQAGETSGTLVENLENIAKQLEKEKELVSKIKGAMLYPVVVLTATFVLGMALSFLVLPKITHLFEGLKMDLPFTTRTIIWFSHFIQKHGFYLFWGIICSLFFLGWIIRQKFSQPVTHWIILNTPIIKNIVRNAALSRFSRTLGMLLRSGINIDEALEISKRTIGNYYFQRALEKVSREIRSGTRLSDNLAYFENIFPIMLTRMIRVGEESGKLEETFFYLANFYESEVDTATKTLSTAIEPILLIIVGLVVAFLALSIITPIYNITGGIKR